MLLLPGVNSFLFKYLLSRDCTQKRVVVPAEAGTTRHLDLPFSQVSPKFLGVLAVQGREGHGQEKDTGNEQSHTQAPKRDHRTPPGESYGPTRAGHAKTGQREAPGPRKDPGATQDAAPHRRKRDRTKAPTHEEDGHNTDKSTRTQQHPQHEKPRSRTSPEPTGESTTSTRGGKRQARPDPPRRSAERRGTVESGLAPERRAPGERRGAGCGTVAPERRERSEAREGRRLFAGPNGAAAANDRSGG